MGREPLLRTIAARTSDVDAKQLAQIERWLEADWESHDIDRDAVRLIGRLVSTLKKQLTQRGTA